MLNQPTSNARQRLASSLVLAIVAASCGGSGDNATVGSNSDPNFEGVRVDFDPSNFVDSTLNTNEFHPLKPGTQWVY